MKEEIKKIVEKAVKKLGNINMPEVLVQTPKDKTHGDYFTNVSFELAKLLKKNPNEIALLLKSQTEKNEIFKKVEAAGGFVNFFIADTFFSENLKQVLKEKNGFGKNDLLKNKKVIVEYTDPNPFKEFHIGHLMSNAIGESISRIFEFQGAKVKRANYQGDVGLHVAKAIWGAQKLESPEFKNHAAGAFNLNLAYPLGSKAYDTDETAKKEIVELNKKIFERSDENVNKLYNMGKKESLAYFEEIYKKLSTKFDYYFFESEVADFGKQIVLGNMGKAFEKGENGAIIFKGENVGLHTRVFINSEGLPTYESKELGLAKIKYDNYKYDQSVIITGNEVNEYFKVLTAAMSQIFPELQKKTMHIGHGMMRLPEGKMSSRAGNVVTAEFLIDELKKLVLEKMADRDMREEEKNEVAEKVAIGAIKYSILKQSIGSDIIYDVEKSISFEGDSGPYLQYSYARAMSVLKKAKAEKIKASLKKVPAETGALEKLMAHFPEVVQKAGKECEPHVIATYLIELAREFNSYYAHNKIVEKGGEYNVAITEAFSIIMKNGLWLLGIQAPEKM